MTSLGKVITRIEQHIQSTGRVFLRIYVPIWFDEQVLFEMHERNYAFLHFCFDNKLKSVHGILGFN
jgi:hypothetical protein